MQSERKRILEMVKNGELTIEEGEKLLEELDEIQRRKDKLEKTIRNEISKDVYFEEKEYEEQKRDYFTGGSKTESTKDKFLSFIETALNKLKEFDLDFHHSVDVTHTLQQNFSEFDTVYVEIPNGSFQLFTWDHTDVRVECDARVYREEDLEKGKERLLRELDFDVRNNRLLLCSNEKFIRLNAKLYFPKQQLEKVTVKLFNGSITVNDLKAKVFDAKTMNGKIQLNNVKSDKGEVETANGSILLGNGTFADLEAETVSGKVDLAGSFGKLDASSISGSVNVSVLNSDADTIRTSSGTGSINIKVPSEVSVLGELKTNLGSVQVLLPDVQKKEEKSEFIQKVMKFEKTGDSGKIYLFADAKTGSVSVRPL